MDIRVRYNLYTHLHKTQKAEKKNNNKNKKARETTPTRQLRMLVIYNGEPEKI